MSTKLVALSECHYCSHITYTLLFIITHQLDRSVYYCMSP